MLSKTRTFVLAVVLATASMARAFAIGGYAEALEGYGSLARDGDLRWALAPRGLSSAVLVGAGIQDLCQFAYPESVLSGAKCQIDPERSFAGGGVLAPGNCSGLTFAIGQIRIYNGPARGRCRPDIARWAAYLGIIQHASSNHHDVGAA